MAAINYLHTGSRRYNVVAADRREQAYCKAAERLK